MRGDDGTVLVLDAGTGIRRLGAQLPPDLARIDILLTHLHMDHIQGLGFFGPLYRPGHRGPHLGPGQQHAAARCPPVALSLAAAVPGASARSAAHHLSRGAAAAVRDRPVPHRDGAGLPPGPDRRLPDRGGRAAVAVYLPDHEPALGLEDGRWLEPEWTSGYELAAGADLLIHDAQYTDAEYACCVGWGHSTYRHAFEFAARVGAKEMVLFHHDPVPRRRHAGAPARGRPAALQARIPRLRRPRRRRLRGGLAAISPV